MSTLSTTISSLFPAELIHLSKIKQFLQLYFLLLLFWHKCRSGDVIKMGLLWLAFATEVFMLWILAFYFPVKSQLLLKGNHSSTYCLCVLSKSILRAHIMSYSFPFIFHVVITPILHLFLTENNLLFHRLLPWLSVFRWVCNRIGWKRPETNCLLLEKRHHLVGFSSKDTTCLLLLVKGVVLFSRQCWWEKADRTRTHMELWLLSAILKYLSWRDVNVMNLQSPPILFYLLGF